MFLLITFLKNRPVRFGLRGVHDLPDRRQADGFTGAGKKLAQLLFRVPACTRK
jgi:hypothetical protein